MVENKIISTQMENKPDHGPRKILVAGGSGFIGRRLIKKLAADIHHRLPQSGAEILCLTRDPESLKDMFDDDIRLVKADVSNYEDLARVMSEQIDIAYYLVHSMEGASKQWKKFSERDRVAAMNFAKVATKYGVRRIIYLGGLIHSEDDNKLSEHMRSRKEVGEILEQHSSSKVTIFQAAVILGQGGGSFQMLQYLVERLPVMICPRWVLTKCQPIAVDDVVEYLAQCIEVKETEGKRFDIGGPEVLTYIDMMRKYAKILNKSVKIIIIPFLTPRLSSYWVDLVTPVRASLARPLIDSLKHDATVQEEEEDDDSIRQLIPVQLKSFEEAVREARDEKVQIKQPNRLVKERSSQKINSNLLMLSLLAMAAIGSTYYIIDGRPEIYHTNWIILGTLWYLGIAFAIYFLRYGAKLGALTAGILGWLTLTFWLIDNLYIVWGISLIASSPDATITIRNFIGAGVAALVVVTSHNLFHKLR